MIARGEIVTIGCKSHGPAWDANTHKFVVLEERPDVFVGVSLGNWERGYRENSACVLPKFAWEVR